MLFVLISYALMEVKGMKELNKMSSDELEKYMEDEIDNKQFHISIHTDDESLYNEILDMVENRCNTIVEWNSRRVYDISYALRFNFMYCYGVAEMSPGWKSQHLWWCHIRNKTEQLSGRKRTVQDYPFNFHPKLPRVKFLPFYERK